ncbi:hypothetical protein B9Z55_009223 [Caenorhabditis nigoni]|nr:hypothetical protein B9Z55_009223 [Caenorhabditis nigoni]
MYGTARELLVDLKYHEERILGVCEFIKYDANWLSEMHNEFPQFQKICLAQESAAACEDWSFEKALKMFKALLPECDKNAYHGFERNLRNFFDSKIGDFHEDNLAIQSFAKYLKMLISRNPELFLPYDKEKNPNCPITVRVFESHGVQFLMKSELFNAINIRNPNSKRLECKEINGKLMAMNYEKVQKKYKDRIGNIEFIKCPIQKTTHKALPIMTPTGGYCILAMDFLFEVLRELIFGYNIFQEIDCEHKLRRFLLRYNEFFSPHHVNLFS